VNISFISFLSSLALLGGCSSDTELKIFCKGNQKVIYGREKGMDEKEFQENITYIFKNKSWNGEVKCQIWNEDEISCESENTITDKGLSKVRLDRISGKIDEYSSKILHEEKVHISISYEGLCEKITNSTI